MRTTTNTKNLEITEAIEAYLEKKLQVLHKYVDEADESVHAAIELAKTTQHHHSGDIFRAEINLHIAGKDFRAAADAKDLYAAIDEMKNGIAREVSSFKKKERRLFRTGAQRIKNILQRFGTR